MTYSETIQRIADNLLNHFAEVHHSAYTVTTDKNRYPAVVSNNDWVNLSPTDTEEIIYIRRAGDDEVVEPLRIGSCDRAYKMRSAIRIVYFRDHADSHNEILAHLMQSVLVVGTRLNRVITDKWKLQKDESNGAYEFGPKTAYFAIDLYVIWDLMGDDCEQDYCISLPNPMCTVESGI